MEVEDNRWLSPQFRIGEIKVFRPEEILKISFLLLHDRPVNDQVVVGRVNESIVKQLSANSF